MKGKKGKSKGRDKGTKEEPPVKRNLVVLDGRETNDWVEMFRGKTLPDGSGIRVVQASWMDTSVTGL